MDNQEPFDLAKTLIHIQETLDDLNSKVETLGSDMRELTKRQKRQGRRIRQLQEGQAAQVGEIRQLQEGQAAQVGEIRQLQEGQADQTGEIRQLKHRFVELEDQWQGARAFAPGAQGQIPWWRSELRGDSSLSAINPLHKRIRRFGF